MNLFTRNRLILLTLAVAMWTTRLHHFDALPDASWAALFLGGFYLRSPLAFLGLMLETVIIDAIATQHLGARSYCLSPAYPMLLPAYAVLWFGGVWAQHRWRAGTTLGAVAVAAVLVGSVSLCFLISDASFYWLSGRVPSPDSAGWLTHFARWYPHFVTVSCAYVAIGVLLDRSRLARGRAASEPACDPKSA